jgi:hypothetical protein
LIYQLNHLLDLKQKQANVSEALSARMQAENTARHAEISAQHAAKGVEQAQLAREQAEATARQGRTVLVFTVVTIIFVSFNTIPFTLAFAVLPFPHFPYTSFSLSRFPTSLAPTFFPVPQERNAYSEKLPLSFVAAFFAINIDRFPWDNGGKLSMNYVLKYMCKKPRIT